MLVQAFHFSSFITRLKVLLISWVWLWLAMSGSGRLWLALVGSGWLGGARAFEFGHAYVPLVFHKKYFGLSYLNISAYNS